MEEKEVVQSEKKKSILPILAIVLVLVVIGVGGYFVAKNFIGSKTPKQIFLSSIEKTFNKTSNIKTKDFKTLTDEFSVSVKITSPLMQNDIFEIINKLDVSGKLALDTENTIVYADIIANYDKLSLINLSAYLNKDKSYLKLNDVFDKWIELGETGSYEMDEFNNIDFNSISDIDLSKYSKILEEVKNALVNSLKDKYFTKEKDNKDNKITLVIDKDNFKTILTDTIKNLKDSKEYQKIYSEITDGNKFNEVAEQLMQTVEKTDLSSFGGIKVDIYTNSKNELKKMNIAIGEGLEAAELEFEQKSDDTFEFAVKMQGLKLISGTIEMKENNGTYTSKYTLNFAEMINIELNVEERIKYDTKLDKVDVSDSVDSSKLEENDFDKLENSAGFKKLKEDIEKIDLSELMGGFESGNENFMLGL